MSAHTPGPWKSDGNTARHEWLTIIGPRGERIAVLYELEAGGAEKANACLISAAPEMLAALKRALIRCHNCDTGGICSECEVDIAAIKKAEGKAA
jgi:hypothetical protein